MINLLPTDRLELGSDYTFHFDTHGIFWTTSGAQSTLLVALSYLVNPKVTSGLLFGEMAVSFTWSGPNQTASEVAGTIIDVLPSEELVFNRAEGGTGAALDSPTGIGDSIVKAGSDAINAVKKTAKDAASGFFDELSKFFSGLKTTGIIILVAIVGIVILILVLAAYGPNVKHIASAVV